VFLLSRFFKKFAKNKNAVEWSEKFFGKSCERGIEIGTVRYHTKKLCVEKKNKRETIHETLTTDFDKIDAPLSGPIHRVARRISYQRSRGSNILRYHAIQSKR